jgi:hypothetical protein
MKQIFEINLSTSLKAFQPDGPQVALVRPDAAITSGRIKSTLFSLNKVSKNLLKRRKWHPTRIKISPMI